MKRNTIRNNARRLRSSQQRRQLLKKLHQKVMQRRKQFQATDLNEEFSEAC